MEIKFKVTAEQRKQLVKLIGNILGRAPVYKGAPSFAYSVNNLTISNDGTLFWDERIDEATVKDLLSKLREQGFTAAQADCELEDQGERLTIETPLNELSEVAFENLKHLVESKASLIRKALDADSVEIEVTYNKVRFPWFSRLPSPEEISAYTRFITSLITMARSVKRVNSREREVDNEKYTFRCFLLRLGFIGEDFKAERKILLLRLDGNAAFKNKPADVESGVDGE